MAVAESGQGWPASGPETSRQVKRVRTRVYVACTGCSLIIMARELHPDAWDRVAVQHRTGPSPELQATQATSTTVHRRPLLARHGPAEDGCCEASSRAVEAQAEVRLPCTDAQQQTLRRSPPISSRRGTDLLAYRCW
jgi:hypothetical protein